MTKPPQGRQYSQRNIYTSTTSDRIRKLWERRIEKDLEVTNVSTVRRVLEVEMIALLVGFYVSMFFKW